MSKTPFRVISLDLDETLIHSRYNGIENIPADFKFRLEEEIHVYVRPYVTEFLDFVYGHFDRVGVFTSANKPYATEIVKNVFADRRVDFFFSRRDCQDDSIAYPSMYGGKMWRTPTYVKDLYKVAKATGASMSQIVAVDDKDVYDDVTKELQNVIQVSRYCVYDTAENSLDAELKDTIETLKLMINNREW